MARRPDSIDPEVQYAGEVPYQLLEVQRDGTFRVPHGWTVGVVGQQADTLVLVLCEPWVSPMQVEACMRAERSRRHKRRLRVERKRGKRR